MEIKIYTSPSCGYCHQAKRYLRDKGLKYNEYDVSIDRAAAEEMVRLTSQTGVPVIVVNNEIIIGFDRQRLDRLLLTSGSNGKISLGLGVADAAKMLRTGGGIPASGAYVGRVRPGSIGDKTGIKVGDIIVSLNYEPIMTSSDIEQVLSGISKSHAVPVRFIREQDTFEREIIIPS